MAPASEVFIRRIHKVDAGEAIVGASFLADTVAFVLAEQAILLASPDSTHRRIAVHEGAILCTAAGERTLITGGDDGRVVATSADGTTHVLATDAQRRWIDSVATDRAGSVAWAAGKNVFVRAADEQMAVVDVPSTVGGLAFSPRDRLLAIAHYNGVTLWHPEANKIPQLLARKGMHLGTSFSPDGAFLVAAMNEPMLHGWRLADHSCVAMQGYVKKVASSSWTPGGKWLATSGSRYLELWPFQQSNNPMSGVPILLAGYVAQASAVSSHPADDVVAVGYEDGSALLIRIEDEAEILLKNRGSSPVVYLAWNSRGNQLALACEDGSARIIDVELRAN